MLCVCSCIWTQAFNNCFIPQGAFLPALMTIKQQPPQNWQTGFQEETDKTQHMDYMFSARNFCLHLGIPEFTKRQKPPSAHSPTDNISHNALKPSRWTMNLKRLLNAFPRVKLDGHISEHKLNGSMSTAVLCVTRRERYAKRWALESLLKHEPHCLW